MEQVIQEINALLADSFPGAAIELEGGTAGERVTGFLIWPGFLGLEQIVRQRRLWHVIRQKLPKEHQSLIAAIFTMTPDEMAAARETP